MCWSRQRCCMNMPSSRKTCTGALLPIFSGSPAVAKLWPHPWGQNKSKFAENKDAPPAGNVFAMHVLMLTHWNHAACVGMCESNSIAEGADVQL